MNPQAAHLTVAEQYLIQQDWAAYTPEQHAVWAELVRRRMPQLNAHACAEYLDGFHQIGLLRTQIACNLDHLVQRSDVSGDRGLQCRNQ